MHNVGYSTASILDSSTSKNWHKRLDRNISRIITRIYTSSVKILEEGGIYEKIGRILIDKLNAIQLHYAQFCIFLNIAFNFSLSVAVEKGLTRYPLAPAFAAATIFFFLTSVVIINIGISFNISVERTF